MDRRELLQAASTFGFGAVLPASAPNELRVGIVGIGGAGGNVLHFIAEKLPDSCRTVAINTHADSLRRLNADRKIRVNGIPDRPVRSDPARRFFVRCSSRTAIPGITEAVAGLEMVLLVAGMGGVAGTEISPIVAQALREQNIFTVGFPIMPFHFECHSRNDIARDGAAELGRHVHSLLPIFNDAFAKAAGEDATMHDALNQVSLAVLQHYQIVSRAVAASRLAGTDLSP